MSRYIAGDDRTQSVLFPERLDDWVEEDNPVRVVDVFVDELDLGALGFDVTPAATGRPAYHPAMLLKLYVYGYLNKVQRTAGGVTRTLGEWTMVSNRVTTADEAALDQKL